MEATLMKKMSRIKTGQDAFLWLKDRYLKNRALLNLSQIEMFCGLGATSLFRAIERDQTDMRESDKLVRFIEFLQDGILPAAEKEE